MADWLLISHDDPSIKKHTQKNHLGCDCLHNKNMEKASFFIDGVFLCISEMLSVGFYCSGWANQNPKHQFWVQNMALWTARCRENLACAIWWAHYNCNNLKNNSIDDDSSKLLYEGNFRFQSFIMGSNFGWQFCLDNSMSIHFHICLFL